MESICKRDLSILLIGFIFLFLALIVQSFRGKYGGQIYVPWIWFIILYIPPIIFLNRSKVEDKEINLKGIKRIKWNENLSMFIYSGINY